MSSVTSYASLLGGMWAPEGSEMSERLKRLQELEQMRKEREARRQELLKEKGPIGVVRTVPLKSADLEADGILEPPGIRRNISSREISGTQEIYSGARPKMIGLSSYGSDLSDGSKSIFSDVTSSLLAPRRTLRSYQGSSDSDDSSSSGQNTFSVADKGYSSLYDEPKLYNTGVPKAEQQESIFSSVTKSLVKPRRAFERRPYTSENTKTNELHLLDDDSKPILFGFNPNSNSNESRDNNRQHFEPGNYSSDSNMKPSGFGLSNSNNNSYDYNLSKIHNLNNNGEDSAYANDNLNEMHEDESEDPKEFIDRLNTGTRYTADSCSNGSHNANSSYLLNSVPAVVPPLKKLKSAAHSVIDQCSDIPALVQPIDDIIAIAQTIHRTFGLPSPKAPNTNNEIEFLSEPQLKHNTYSRDGTAQAIKEESHLQENEQVEGINGDYSITYDIHEDNYDSSGDERGKVLPVRDSLYKADPSQWMVVDQTPGKLDRMQEYFTGKKVVEDPNISRELDGSKVREELEMSYFGSQLEKDNLTTPKQNGVQSDKNKQSSASKRSEVPTKSSLRNTQICNGTPITNGKITANENDKVQTSQSGHDSKKGLTRYGTPQQNDKNETKSSMNKPKPSPSDKQAVLESLTKEKSKKHVNGNIESMAAGTNERLSMQALEKDDSLKQFETDLKEKVHENCSQLGRPTKLLNELLDTKQSKNLTKEICTQTDLISIPNLENVYICKHCGKSSDEAVNIVLSTDDGKKSSIVNNDKIFEYQNEKEAVLYEVNVGSKDSVKSFGDASVKSDIKEVKSKPVKSSGHSYMRGTTSSRLKNTGQGITDTKRKASVPELYLYNSNVTNGKDSTADTINQERDNATQKVSATNKSMSFEKTKLEGKLDKENSTLVMSLGNSGDQSVTKINNTFQNAKSKMIKSKSVDQVSIPKKDTSTKNEQSAIKQPAKKEKVTLVTNKSNVTDKRARTGAKLKSVCPKPISIMHTGDTMNLSSLEKKICEDRVTSQLCSPITETSEDKVSPRSECEFSNDSENVESKSQFTTLENNPFIKNDGKCTNSLKVHEKVESVWEKQNVDQGIFP